MVFPLVYVLIIIKKDVGHRTYLRINSFHCHILLTLRGPLQINIYSTTVRIILLMIPRECSQRNERPGWRVKCSGSLITPNGPPGEAVTSHNCVVRIKLYFFPGLADARGVGGGALFLPTFPSYLSRLRTKITVAARSAPGDFFPSSDSPTENEWP